jgi:hypothetical protein
MAVEVGTSVSFENFEKGDVLWLKRHQHKVGSRASPNAMGLPMWALNLQPVRNVVMLVKSFQTMIFQQIETHLVLMQALATRGVALLLTSGTLTKFMKIRYSNPFTKEEMKVSAPMASLNGGLY